MSATSSANEARTVRNNDRTAEAIARVREALDGLRYGEVVVKVQDGVVVQVERTERLRWKDA